MSFRYRNGGVRRRLKLKLSETQNHRCCFCGIKMLIDGRGCTPENHRHSATFEHVIPRSFYGKDEVSNLAISCRACNSKRNTIDSNLWYKYTIGDQDSVRQIEHAEILTNHVVRLIKSYIRLINFRNKSDKWNYDEIVSQNPLTPEFLETATDKDIFEYIDNIYQMSIPTEKVKYHHSYKKIRHMIMNSAKFTICNLAESYNIRTKTTRRMEKLINILNRYG